VNGAPGANGEVMGPSWSPDGRKMVFHREVESGWPPHRAALSRDPRYRLIRTGVFPSYSPGGEQLVLNDGTAGIVHNNLLMMNADGAQRSTVVGDPELSALGGVWSARGNWIAFAFGRFFPGILGPAAARIAIVHPDGSGLTLITDSTGNAGFPSWSPDERQIVYRSTVEGRASLMIVDVKTRVVRTLTDGTFNDNSPAWSPLGDRIAFTSRRDGTRDYDLFSIRTDGTDLRRLTSAPGNDSHPAWSPDGQWLVFTSGRGGFKDESALHPFNPQPYGDLYVMRADGSDVQALTDNQFEDGTPTWVPTHRAQ
jgi:TolB protein